VRKYLALVVGVVFAMGGAIVVLELLFVAPRVPLLWLFGAGFVATIGCYLVWETLRDWRKT
jgi:hypothetical protein